MCQEIKNISQKTLKLDSCLSGFNNPTYSFKDYKCYQDGVYFGDIISSDNNQIIVNCNNGNRYMQDTKIIFNRIKP
jgi:hypothetical protein